MSRRSRIFVESVRFEIVLILPACSALKECCRIRQPAQYVPAVNSRTRGSQLRGPHGLPQHVLQHAPNSLGDQLVAFCSGVDAVDLIETRPRGDVFKQKRN